MNLLKIFCSLLALFLVSATKENMSDYEIYELIDSLNALTDHSTFYALLDVEPTASAQQIASNYRKMSSSWHPDKNTQDPNATAKFSLLSGIHTILKNEKTRKRYDWLVNEAPAWHRSGYYYSKYVTAKLSVFQVLFISLVFVSVGQLAALYAKYFSDLYHFKGHQKTVNEMGDKEMKRLKRKVGFSPVLSPEMVALMKLEQGISSKPKFSDLLICQLIFFICRSFKRILLLLISTVFLLPRALLQMSKFPFFFASFLQTKKEKKFIEESETADGAECSKTEETEKNTKVNRWKQWQLAGEDSSNQPHRSISKEDSFSMQPSSQDKELKSGPFSEQEISHLIQLMKAVPAGSVDRWVVISKKMSRSVDEVMSQVQNLKSKLKKLEAA